MEKKVCGTCKIEFPKTEEYFFKRVIKQQNKSGFSVYYSFKSNCIKCHGKKGMALKIKKRCQEMNCEVSEYRENWKKQYSKTRTKYIEEISHLPVGTRNTIMKKIHGGYKFTNYEKYRLDWRKELSKSKRKYDYGNLDFIPKGTQAGIKNITDAYIALCLKKSVKEIPKEMIETKRLIIKLKRLTNGK